jgi:hypothetical protein
MFLCPPRQRNRRGRKEKGHLRVAFPVAPAGHVLNTRKGMMRRLRTSEDIENLADHITKVDPVANPLNRILQHYYIHPFSIKCGLSGCGKVHKEGCLVELKDHHITNIGHVCGARFGERFQRQRTENYDNVWRPRLIQTITQAQSRLATNELKHHQTGLQASDLESRSRDFREMFPGILETLLRRAFNNDSDVAESVARSKEEIGDLMAANPFQSREALAFRDKRVGTISGFRFPTHDWSISTGFRKLFSELTKFSELTPRSLSRSDLQRWAHWAEDFDGNLGEAVKAIEDGNNFFTPANFQLFAVFTPSAEMKARLRTLQVSDIRPPRAATSHQPPMPASTPRRGLGGAVSPRELRRLTGSKKSR